MGDFEFRPLTPATWEAFAVLAEKHNGVSGGCWAHATLVFDGDVAVG